MNIEIMPDIPRVFTGFAEWLACLIVLLPHRSYVNAAKFIPLSAGMLILQNAFLAVTGGANVRFWLLFMAVAFALMFIYIKLGSTVSVMDGAYSCVRAFIIAEFAASFEWQINCYIFPYDNPPEENQSLLPTLMVGGIIILVIVYSCVFVSAWLFERKFYYGRLSVTPKELTVALMVGAATFALSNLSFVIPNTLFGGVLGREIMSFRTVVDLVGIAVLYAHYAVCREYRAVREFTSLYGIVHTQNTYYQSYKDSLELINRKYHDLKYQIVALRAERNEDKRRDFLDKMESEIKTFEAQNKTGNIVLDTILTTKALYCQSREISLTVVADGAELSFMSTSDLASLFGNMLDNAVQSAEKLPDKEQRLITLTVAHQKGFILVKTENYFEGDMVFADGLPKTTKFNKDYHGYGLKSIRQIAKEYDGVMSINTEGNWFVLTLLFPEVREGSHAK